MSSTIPDCLADIAAEAGGQAEQTSKLWHVTS